MGYKDRIRPAIYTAPSGQSAEFIYDVVGLDIAINSTAYTFPGVSGTYVSEHGHSGRRYPITAFFVGDNHDLLAENFVVLLSEKGIGKLDHPLYGVIDVVPFGRISKRNNMSQSANLTTINCEFWETIDTPHPLGDVGFNAPKNHIETYTETLHDHFVTQPADINVFDFSRILISRSKLFWLTHDYVFNTLKDWPDKPKPEELNNISQFNSHDILQQLYFTKVLSESINIGVYATREQAINAADNIFYLMLNLEEWREESLNKLNADDVINVYESMQSTTSSVAGHLVDSAFVLRQERVIITDRDHAVVDLVGLLYRNVDENLEEFISINNLSGDQYREIKRGTEIVYRV